MVEGGEFARQVFCGLWGTLGTVVTVSQPSDDERFLIDNVEPLIVGVEAKGASLEFLFRCPVSGFEVSSRVKPTPRLADPYSGSMVPRLSHLVESALRPVGETGRAAADPGNDWSVSEIEAAACEAFAQVASDFLWNGMRWTYWEAEDRVLEFLEFADALEALTTAQREVLRKVLVSVALADGRVQDSEEQLLQTLLGLDHPTQGGGSPPSPAELDRITSRTLASAILVFGYAVASVDGRISEAENEVLERVASHFGFRRLRLWELKRVAQSFVVDEALARLYERDEVREEDRERVFAMARGLGLSSAEAQVIAWRFLKRVGLQ